LGAVNAEIKFARQFGESRSNHDRSGIPGSFGGH
jgi:hypothetical protein